ncbi:hypothetical protein ACSBR2_018502 [Camellia fascicularis]
MHFDCPSLDFLMTEIFVMSIKNFCYCHIFVGSSLFGQKPAFGGFASRPNQSDSSGSVFQQTQTTFGSSLFGQKPAFGGFASRPNQSDSSGSVFQQTQTTFGSNPFGSSTPFDASTQNAFGAGSPPAFGAASTSTFAVASTPTFGSSSTSIFGSTGTAFAVSSAPAFGFGTGAAFGASNTLGTLNTSILGASNSSAFGASGSPAFGTSSTTGFGFGTTRTYGQSTSASGSSSIFEATPSLFGTQSSSFGAQTTMPTFGTTSFGPSAFGGQRGGSRVAAYTATAEVDGGSRTQPAVKLQSLLAMTVYKDKSHEELRLEDYQLGDKGGPCHVGQSAGGFGVGGSTTQSNAFGPSPTLTQSSPNPFSSSVSSNPLAPQTSTPNPFPTQTPSNNPFATQTSTPIPFALQTSTPNPFPTQTPSPNPFATQTSSPIPFPPQTFSNLLTPQTSSNLSAPQTSSPNPYASQTSSNPFAPQTISNALAHQTPYNSFAPITPAPSSSGSVASSVLGFNSLLFSTSSFANTFKTTSSPPCSILTASGPGPVSGPNSCPSLFSSSSSPVLGPSPSIFSSTSALGTASGIGSGLSSANTQSSPAFRSSTQSTVVVQPAPVVSPFGALPAMPQLSIAHPGSTPSIRYGISSMPVFVKPAAPVRLSSLLTSRHLSQRRIRLPARKYDPKNDVPKVPFFSNDGEMPTAPKAGTLFVPRENPRALVINPAEQWPQRPNNEKMSPLLRASYVHIYNNGSVSENSADKEGTSSIKSNHKPNNPCNITFTEKEALHIITSTGCKAGEAAILQEQETDVEALMPRLQRSGYYTEPQIHELAVKERAEPGFCCRVKDFVVGRHGYGNIKFLGDTDVRQLDLDSDIHFDNCELTVYMDESKKPPVGQGLNKPAEVTLLNIKCIDKKTGKQYINGPKVDKYREMLMKKAIKQGAEFVSYDPVKWEWKFRVQDF